MTTTLRWLLVAVLAGHGLLHLLCVAKGFGWADVSQLTEPIGVRTGVSMPSQGSQSGVEPKLLAVVAHKVQDREDGLGAGPA